MSHQSAMKASTLMLLAAVMSSCLIRVAEGRWANELGRSLIVLAAPSVWDVHYRHDFFNILEYQMSLARQMQRHENVVVLADKHTVPYLTGRTHKLKQKLPHDMIVQANIYDIRIRDFAPFGNRHPVKFLFRSREMGRLISRQIDNSMRRFLRMADFRFGANESMLILNGGDVVNNGVDKAIINKDALKQNKGRMNKYATTLKLYKAFQRVAAMVPTSTFAITQNTSLRFDDIMAFVDDNALVIPMLGAEDRANVDAELWKRYRSNITIIDLPTNHNDDYMRPAAGVCGMYSALLTTKDFVYVPSFGSDPSNWHMGHSSMMDRVVFNIIAASTRKTVVPVSMPRKMCKLGYGLRGITWDVRRSANADKIVQLGRRHGRRRLYRH